MFDIGGTGNRVVFAFNFSLSMKTDIDVKREIRHTAAAKGKIKIETANTQFVDKNAQSPQNYEIAQLNQCISFLRWNKKERKKSGIFSVVRCFVG